MRDPDSAFHSDADPDPAFHFDAFPDPTFQFDAGPDLDPICQFDAGPIRILPLICCQVWNCSNFTDYLIFLKCPWSESYEFKTREKLYR